MAVQLQVDTDYHRSAISDAPSGTLPRTRLLTSAIGTAAIRLVSAMDTAGKLQRRRTLLSRQWGWRSRRVSVSNEYRDVCHGIVFSTRGFR